ncbi:hypothetical protein QKW35_06110 [Pontibacterium granulatum]|uniref:hypothetical protein n=1 Tax=Pontibacterium granulatum TaxID=2036029 RepID=UPI002499EC97|nr:hypothetical protein [Pontibacterium granulatum]MDI3323943.1 hypothetical protein [Pontibacterium granulatum]
MSIQQTQAYSAVNPVHGTMHARTTGVGSGSGEVAIGGNQAAQADRSVAVSDQARAYAASEAVYQMDTGGGATNIDLETYFTPKQNNAAVLSFDGLLMPTARNVATLQAHISKVFPDFLAANGIPEAPDKITYDGSGNVVLPDDYPYSDKLKAALASDPAMARELSTANALASHVAGMQATQPFHDEYEQAKSQAEIDAIIDKYSYLFGDNRRYPDIALLFSDQGALTITADSKALV